MSRPTPAPAPCPTPIIAIRQATEDDDAALRRLAALDSAPMPTGTVLVGVLDGEIVAATPLAGGRGIADPFRPTSDVVALLEVRAARLRGEDRAPRRSRRTERGRGPAGAMGRAVREP